MGRARRVIAAACFVTSIAGAAGADPVPSLDLRGFRPPADPRGSLSLEPAGTVGAGQWNVGLYASYANRLVTIEDDSGEVVRMPLEHQLSMDYVASLGIGGRLAVSVALPSVVYQEGDDLSDLTSDPGILPQTALGDAALGAKVALVIPGQLRGFSLAGVGHLTLPTGDERSYLGEGALTGDVGLLAQLETEGIALRALMGVHLRQEFETYFGQRFGHDLPWGVGVAIGPELFTGRDRSRWEAYAELHGAVAATPSFASGPQSPVLGGIAARHWFGNVSALVGVELPIGSAVGTPRARGVLGIGWAPRFYDADGDGIADKLDHCPQVAEDRDGFEDDDGCVDFDNDHDGVPDTSDACPLQPEDRDGYEDGDGCPDPDNDGDGVPDQADECPDTPGVASENGCEVPDTDGDGVVDSEDWCPERAEDRDGYQDADGCPDLDNDGDGVPDSEDSCRDEAGAQRSEPELHGCPTPDGDGDTFDDDVDQCPGEPEDFDGVDDTDGCPDADADRPYAQRGRLLVEVAGTDAQPVLRWRVAPRVVRKDKKVLVAPESEPVLRAIAQILNDHQDWVLLIGVRPRGVSAEAQSAALMESFVLANELHQYTHRDDVAESVGWDAVARQPGAQAAGVGMLVVRRSVPETP